METLLLIHSGVAGLLPQKRPPYNPNDGKPDTGFRHPGTRDQIRPYPVPKKQSQFLPPGISQVPEFDEKAALLYKNRKEYRRNADGWTILPPACNPPFPSVTKTKNMVYKLLKKKERP
ncbi:hypothetical protein OOT00_11600 [Desulfobotulus sp. H1]|uniref:Uncharacterized protein n=1 Tax=Desulfobotulus pelophilus TaxID=2823377 RepID=A0ABT3NAY7_9BACT|nr:hypothetical protein [Desulfobotulus pelophilus]MCW7754629.1 hypothetical protein [Desulfobotulus pelophilus]